MGALVRKINDLRVHAAHWFGNGEKKKAKKSLANARRMKAQLQVECAEQVSALEPGFAIFPGHFDPIITKLSKSNDPLFKSELNGAIKAKSELQYLRRIYYKANKLEAIRIRHRLIQIEEKYHYLDRLQEVKRNVLDIKKTMPPLDIYTKVKGYRKIEVGHVVVYCRHSGMGIAYKNRTNKKAAEAGWRSICLGTNMKRKHTANIVTIRDDSMTDDDWEEAISLADTERQQLTGRLPAKTVATRPRVDCQITTISQAVEDCYSKNPRDSQSAILQDWVIAGVQVDDLAFFNLEMCKDVNTSQAIQRSGTTVRYRNQNKEYCVFERRIRATVAHCKHNVDNIIGIRIARLCMLYC
jgi:hypothetical protein